MINYIVFLLTIHSTNGHPRFCLISSAANVLESLIEKLVTPDLSPELFDSLDKGTGVIFILIKF